MNVKCSQCGWTGTRETATVHPRQGFIVCPACWRRGVQVIPTTIMSMEEVYEATGFCKRLEDEMTASEQILTDALRAIAHALKEPDGGDYWKAREFLDRYDVFHSDLSGTRVLNQVALTAMDEVKKLRRVVNLQPASRPSDVQPGESK